MTKGGVRVNVGCGQTTTPGWINYDNSPSIRLAKHPYLVRLLKGLGLLQEAQLGFIRFARHASIHYADATRRIPLPTGAAEVLYASHMLEHLDRVKAREFLREAMRVLSPGGTLRLSVPDLKIQVERYLNHQDADAFLDGAYLDLEKPHGLKGRLAFLLFGGRQHQWIYDGESLSRLLTEAGFDRPEIMPAGKTRIPSPGGLNLREREEESVYVEALRP